MFDRMCMYIKNDLAYNWLTDSNAPQPAPLLGSKHSRLMVKANITADYKK